MRKRLFNLDIAATNWHQELNIAKILLQAAVHVSKTSSPKAILGARTLTSPIVEDISKVVGVPLRCNAERKYLSDLLKWFKTKISENQSILYSGSRGNGIDQIAETYAEVNNLAFYPIVMEGLPKKLTPINYSGVDRGLVDDYESAAMALATSGRVRIFLPEEGLTSSTTFTRVEWPNLMPPRNNMVSEVYWVDSKDTTNMKLIWEQGDCTEFPMNKRINVWAAEKGRVTTHNRDSVVTNVTSSSIGRNHDR
jgi:hypothetical protein